MDIVARAQEAGVAGTAGAGHPLHDRLTRRVDTVIANGAECEPLIASDGAVMARYPEQVLSGLTLVMQATDASRGMLAVRAGDSSSLRALTQARRRNPGIGLEPVEDYYPAGDATALVRSLTGRQVPPGGHPEDVGVMVVNVQTLWHLAEAARGRPVTHRFVTVAGEVAKPQTLRAPLGTTLADLVAQCGGPTRPDAVLVEGGPMRGRVADPETSIRRTTQAVLVLPADHAVVARSQLPIDAMIRRAASSCGGCRLCTDRCPQTLGGYGIQPHLLMRGLAHRLDSASEVVMGAGSCSGCRVCEAVCPAGLSPGRLYGAIGEDLLARGLQTLPRNPAKAIHEALQERRVARAWLTDRLGVARYAQPLPVDDNYHPVPRVSLSIPNAEPLVSAGQKVKLGEPVSKPRGLGVREFSPIDGRVSLVTDGRIEIRRD